MNILLSFCKRVLVKSGVSRLFYIDRGTYRLKVYPSSLSLALWINPFCRYSTERFFQRYLRSGDVVVDVGANIGTLTLEASVVVGNTGKVYAIEAHPKLFQYLVGNIGVNKVDNVRAFNIAVGNDRVNVLFSDNLDDDTQNKIITTGKGMLIQQHRLDDLSIDDKIALLKIDVEGYEKFVLEGAEQLLRKTACIYLEWCNDHFLKYGYTSNELYNHLRERDFRLFYISDELVEIIRMDMFNKCKNIIATKDPSYLRERYR